MPSLFSIDSTLLFVEVDKTAFMKQGENAVYESLSPEMQEVHKSIKKITQ